MSFFWQTQLGAPVRSPQYFLGTIIVRLLNPARLFYQPPAAVPESVSNANCFEFDRPFLLKMPIVRL
ncbi:hypothetical protein QUA44_14460 [Microcoleus sp. N9_A2]|uniref:hypothetical protein n=1 Tax=unclassified Microcoleus TaxID=2642155 RepID=UPI002FD6F25B